MTNLFGTAERHAEVNRVMEGVIAQMAGLGAKLIRFDLPEYDVLASAVSTSQFEARTVMDRYFAALGPNAPIKSFAASHLTLHKGSERLLTATRLVRDFVDEVEEPLVHVLVVQSLVQGTGEFVQDRFRRPLGSKQSEPRQYLELRQRPRMMKGTRPHRRRAA